MPRARRVAQSALECDPSLAEAHAVISFVGFAYDWDWTHEAREFARVIALNERLAIARQWHSLFLSAHGRFDEAIAECAQVVDLDPLSALAHAVHGVAFMYARRVDECLAAVRRAEELDPHVWIGRLASATALGAAGRYDEALADNERVLSASQRHGWPLAQHIELNARLGRRLPAELALEELLEQSRTRYVSQTVLAIGLAASDHVDEAAACFERAYRDRESLVIWNNWPFLPTAFGRDPRFAAVMKRVGLNPGYCFVKPA